MDKNAYATRDKANQGTKVFLSDPLTNKVTKDWLWLVGKESDRYRAEEYASKQRITDRLSAVPRQKDTAAYKAAMDRALNECLQDEQCPLLASLITQWCFDDVVETPSHEEATEWLRTVPQIMDQIDSFVSNRAHFLGVVSSSSAPTQTPSSDSTNAQEAQPAPSEPT